MNQPPYGQAPAPNPPWGAPQSPPQAPVPPQGPPPTQPGKPPAWWGGYASIAILALSFLLVIGTIVAAVQSEQMGMTMTMITAGPLFFGLVGTIVAIVTKKNPKPSVAIGAPLGCGCLAAIVGALLVAVFFLAIFPSL
ncbi:MAG TPA: hypothetical protein PLI95_06370 [Polyangiaceae bacterium]|nr:hypothetical protein [Polyangiaceae bacterium]